MLMQRCSSSPQLRKRPASESSEVILRCIILVGNWHYSRIRRLATRMGCVSAHGQEMTLSDELEGNRSRGSGISWLTALGYGDLFGVLAGMWACLMMYSLLFTGFRDGA